jgi:hypothetical protein
MTAVTFDTLQLVKDLEASGIKPQQAEAINKALKEVINAADVATVRDLKEFEANINFKLAETKAEIIKWNTGAIVGSVALAVTLIKMFGA